MNEPSTDVVRQFINSRVNASGYLAVRLTRGVVYGSTFWPQVGDASKDVMRRGRRQLVPDLLFRCSEKAFCLYTIDVGISVYQFKVPYASVEAAFEMPRFESRIIESEADPMFIKSGFTGSFRDDEMRALLDLTTETISTSGLQYRKVVDVNYVDSFPHPATFPVWLPARVLAAFPLYCDRDSHSVDDIWALLRGGCISVSDVLGMDASYRLGVRVAGYLSFFDSPITVVMEGATWELCCITDSHTPQGIFADQHWVLGAIKPRWLLTAKEFIERIGERCRFLGDIFPFAMELQPYGTKSSLFKIRAAACLPDEQVHTGAPAKCQLVLGTAETSRLPIVRSTESPLELQDDGGDEGFECHSCFLSHSSKDSEFCHRLYSDLTGSGVPCWMFEYNAKVGEKIWQDISNAMSVYDKVVVVLSEHSLRSGPVLNEIERALRREDIERRIILIPIRIDDALSTSTFERRPELDARTIGDFREWRKEELYQSALQRLLTSLRKHASGAPS